MLTIREPLTLYSTKPICGMMNPLSEKIRDNYDMFRAKFQEEELLHMVTQPPEIYMGVGSMTSLVQNTKIDHNQNIKMELMNNLVNRIVLMNQNEFTYQDTVFVENMLQKLGIHDVKTFMKQVQNLQEDTNQTSQLIDLYWGNYETLQNIVNTVREKVESTKNHVEAEDEKKTEPEKELPVYYIHDKIFQRLQTGLIYEELKNFFAGIPGQEQKILQRELSISEQARQAQNIVLNKLQNIVQKEDNPLLYHRYNLYEEGDSTWETENNTSRMRNLISAVMLNLLDNVYEIRHQDISVNKSSWYDISQALQHSSSNTFKRYEEYRSNVEHISQQSVEYVTNMNQAKKNEYNTLNKILQITENQYEENVLNSQKNIHQNYFDEQHTKLENIESKLQEIQYLQKDIPEKENANPTQKNENYQVIKQQLDMINQQNIERLQQVQLLGKFTSNNVQINVEKSRKDALRALNDPQGVMLEYREQLIETEQEEKLSHTKLEEIMSEETREIYKLVDEYRKNPAQAIANNMMNFPVQQQLEREVTQVIREREKANLEYIQGENFTEQVEHIVEQYREPEKILNPKFNRIEESVENIQLIHKHTENILSEDILEELQYQNQVLQKKTEVMTQEEETNRTVVTKNNINTTNQIVEQTTQDVTNLVKEGLQRNLNSISEQVYNRLEKKLVTERKRRGY